VQSVTTFNRLIWRQDRMLLDDLVFRIEHFKSSGTWEKQAFRFYKTKALVDQYRAFWVERAQLRPRRIFELGLWDGGSLAFWFECFRPEKLVGVDLAQRGGSTYFRHYVATRGLQERIQTYCGTDQADSATLRRIVEHEFVGPLDLVIDDASHLYAPSKASFEALFRLVRPKGLYVIEDWAWAHWAEFQSSDHAWAGETELTRLVFELVEAVGSSRSLIAGISVFQGFAVVERGELELADVSQFRLDRFISRRRPMTWMRRALRRLGQGVHRLIRRRRDPRRATAAALASTCSTAAYSQMQ
jgi:SAM-dependent methyltransferase